MVDEFVYRLIELRKQKGVSRDEMARVLHIAVSTYAGYEQGYRDPSLLMLKKIANYFECSLDYLLGRSDDFGIINIPTDLSPDEKELIAIFNKLYPKHREQLLEFARFCDMRAAQEGPDPLFQAWAKDKK